MSSSHPASYMRKTEENIFAVTCRSLNEAQTEVGDSWLIDESKDDIHVDPAWIVLLTHASLSLWKCFGQVLVLGCNSQIFHWVYWFKKSISKMLEISERQIVSLQ